MTLDVDKIISELTLGEKVQLIAAADVWHTAEIERLNIPCIRVTDGPNGTRGTKYFNSFPAACLPCGTALGATFDKSLLFETGELLAQEAKTKGAHVVLAPTVNMQRSPLGGRGFESFGEDPVLSGYCAASMINGMQSKGIASTLKHYICNDMEHERYSTNSIVGERALRELYLLPFQLAIRDSNPKSIMTSYNKVNGEHTSQSKKLLQDILRDEWNWDGMLMSDWYGTYSVGEPIKNGLDLEMPGPPQFRKPQTVSHMVNTKEVHVNSLNERVKNVLKLVNYATENSGLPGKKSQLPEDSSNNTPETAAFLRKLCQDSIVLLKNEGNLLPLSKDEKIAVIGPNAKFAAYCGGDSASLTAYYTTTPYDAISSKLSYQPEYTVGATAYKSLPELGEQLRKPDGSVGYLAKFYLEPPGTENRTLIDQMEMTSSYIYLSDYNHPKITGSFYIDFEGDLNVEKSGFYDIGTSVFGTSQIFVDDELVADNKTVQKPSLQYSYVAEEVVNTIELSRGKTYKVRIEFGTSGTSTLPARRHGQEQMGAISFGMTKHIEDYKLEIERACEIAKNHDKVVVCVGLSKEWEAEGSDRPHMDLPGHTDLLISEILKVQPNTIVVNQSGTPVTMPWATEVPALLQAWFSGNEGGNAIGDILFGDANPSGKLSLTFPVKLKDNPSYLNYRSNNGQVLYGEDVYIGYKFYEKIDRKVLFPFGFGLSYTSFELSGLSFKLSGDELKVYVDIKNIGSASGAEVIQVYISPHNPSITRPTKELKDFSKVYLKSGESESVCLSLSLKYATSFYHEYQDSWCSEKGNYDILVGTSSDAISLKGTFSVDKTTFWKGI